MILLIDNYDSFSYNLFQLIGGIEPNIKVIRNDEKSPKEIEKMSCSSIIISPGPGKPKDAGYCEDIIDYFAGKLPILGICLGHQAICEVFGSKITYADKIMHGKTSIIEIDNSQKIFNNLPKEIEVARYHSLVVDKTSLTDNLKVIAETVDDEVVMAVRHKDYEIYGLQFHPESILTPTGVEIAHNFIELVAKND
jgi:anthranilate synthase component 2